MKNNKCTAHTLELILTSKTNTPAMPSTPYCNTGHTMSMTRVLMCSRSVDWLTVLGVPTVLVLRVRTEDDGSNSGTENKELDK